MSGRAVGYDKEVQKLRWHVSTSPCDWQENTLTFDAEVADKTFGVNDYVYINHGDARVGEDVPETGHCWLARVLEIRAMNQSSVYLRVYWMYWPDELPGGRQPYHGRQELIASNHMDIVDAMTVSDGAEVAHVVETDENASTVDGLYWRQTLDFLTNKLSVQLHLLLRPLLLVLFKDRIANIVTESQARLYMQVLS